MNAGAVHETMMHDRNGSNDFLECASSNSAIGRTNQHAKCLDRVSEGIAHYGYHGKMARAGDNKTLPKNFLSS